MPERFIEVVAPEDNVGTLLRDVEADETVEIEVGDDVLTLAVEEDVDFGHKVAITDVPEGDTIYKYGTSIGYASTDVARGEWVHVHNVDSNYGRGDLAADDAATAVSE